MRSIHGSWEYLDAQATVSVGSPPQRKTRILKRQKGGGAVGHPASFHPLAADALLMCQTNYCCDRAGVVFVALAAAAPVLMRHLHLAGAAASHGPFLDFLVL